MFRLSIACRPDGYVSLSLDVSLSLPVTTPAGGKTDRPVRSWPKRCLNEHKTYERELRRMMMEPSTPVASIAPESALDPRRWWALALLCGAFFMVILDAAIVIVALPSIQADLGFSEQRLQWVLSAYAVTFAGLLLLGGRA